MTDLKLVKLLEEDKDYYEIVLARVREIKDPARSATTTSTTSGDLVAEQYR